MKGQVVKETLYQSNAGTLHFLAFFACFWKDNHRSVSKPFKNSKKVSKRKINKHQIYITC